MYTRPAPSTPLAPRYGSFGTLHCGAELMAAAWPTMQHTFALGPGVDSTSTLRFPEGRPPQDLLRNHPVDLLISEHTTFQPHHAKGPPLHVLDVVSRAVLPPRLVIEIWDPAASTWDHGPLSKGIVPGGLPSVTVRFARHSPPPRWAGLLTNAAF